MINIDEVKKFAYLLQRGLIWLGKIWLISKICHVPLFCAIRYLDYCVGLVKGVVYVSMFPSRG